MKVNEDVLSLLKNKIRDQMNELADHLAMGGAQNMEEYRKICGTIEGLAWTEREIINIEDRLGEL
tara:strand:+ start:507 stop:701 length:195 start_codon:yes stop_codon:yes gene_type:complete